MGWRGEPAPDARECGRCAGARRSAARPGRARPGEATTVPHCPPRAAGRDRNLPIPPEDITGLILAGGRGSRMGGVDKGLQNHQGMPLALHALLRLQPQVATVMINANRNLGAYESMGVPVWPDAVADYPGRWPASWPGWSIARRRTW